jgi:hypothetical protein
MRVLAMSCVLLVTTPAARAQDRPSVVVDLGLGSAVGSLGISYTQPVAPMIFEAGVGWGFTGTQVSAMAGVMWRRWLEHQRPHARAFARRLGPSSNAIASAVGVSISLPRAAAEGGRDVWLTADAVTLSARLQRFAVRASFGLTMIVHGDTRVCLGFDHGCTSDDVTDLAFVPLPQFRVGVGFAF